MYRLHGYAKKGGKRGVAGEIRLGKTKLKKITDVCSKPQVIDVLIAVANVQLSAKNRKLFD